MTTLSLGAEFPAVTEAQWRERAEKALKGKPFDSLITQTLNRIAIQPLYEGPADAPRLSLNKLSLNNLPTDEMPWRIVQRIDMPDPAEANRQVLADLEGGAGGLALVLPGSIHAGAHGVGSVAPQALERVFDGVDLALVSLRIDAGPYGKPLSDAIMALYRKRGLDTSRCQVSFGFNPPGRLALYGTAPEMSAVAAHMADRFGAIRAAGFLSPVFHADGRVFHEAGASEVQELAGVIGSAVAMLRLLESAGVEPQDAAGAIEFTLCADADQFMTIAKLRALRLMWTQVRKASGLDDEPAALHAATSLRMMARYDPHVNLLRTTTAAFAAGVGGADSVTVLPFTLAAGLPDGFARRMARNTQVILQEESGIGRVRDAAAGSGFAETLTRQLAQAAWGLFQQMEERGGLIDCLTSGWVQDDIADVCRQREELAAERRIGLTGVSEFPNLSEMPASTLDRMPADLPEAPKVAGISCQPLVPARLAQPFEALRDAAHRSAQGANSRPTVFLATLATAADFTARTTWTANLLAAGGVDTVAGPVDEFSCSGASIAIICSSDEVYAAEGVSAVRSLKAAGAKRILLAGRVGKIDGCELLSEEIDGEVSAGIDVLQWLREMHVALGIGSV